MKDKQVWISTIKREGPEMLDEKQERWCRGWCPI